MIRRRADEELDRFNKIKKVGFPHLVNLVLPGELLRFFGFSGRNG